MIYSIANILKPKLILPKTKVAAITGGSLSGFFAGIIGLGGAIRSTFLHSFHLPKITYIFTTNIIALAIDVTRLSTYVAHGSSLNTLFAYGILFSIPFSILGAILAKRFVEYLPTQQFRTIVTIFFGIFGLYFLIR